MRSLNALMLLALAAAMVASVLGDAGLPTPGGDRWVRVLRRRISDIDRQVPGAMGVYVKRLSDGSVLNYDAGREWYLASTIKVPVAIAVLQLAEAGALSLDEERTLRQEDYVDGTGALLWKNPGTRFTLGFALEKMLTESDSSATDVLIRRIGLERLNQQVRANVAGEGFGQITSLLEVRRDAYRELHPKARTLTNLDFIALKRIGDPEGKLQWLISRLGISRDELRAKSIDEAFERYYSRHRNSATLEAYAVLLERLARGQLLSAANTRKLLGILEKIATGRKRIKAGLRRGLRFAQKTGTQLRRICNVGIVWPHEGGVVDGVVITACLEGFDSAEEAEAALSRLGAELGKVGLFESRS